MAWTVTSSVSLSHWAFWEVSPWPSALLWRVPEPLSWWYNHSCDLFKSLRVCGIACSTFFENPRSPWPRLVLLAHTQYVSSAAFVHKKLSVGEMELATHRLIQDTALSVIHNHWVCLFVLQLSVLSLKMSLNHPSTTLESTSSRLHLATRGNWLHWPSCPQVHTSETCVVLAALSQTVCGGFGYCHVAQRFPGYSYINWLA